MTFVRYGVPSVDPCHISGMLKRVVPWVWSIPLVMGCAAAETNGAVGDPGPAGQVQTEAVGELSPDSTLKAWVVDGVVHFRGGQAIRTELLDVELLGVVERSVGMPWVIIQGRDRDQATAPLVIRVLDPERGPGEQLLDEHLFRAPGTLVDGRTEATYYAADVFIGTVLPGVEGLVWYERVLLPNQRWTNTTTVVALSDSTLERTVHFGHGRLALTQGLAFRGACMLLPRLEQRVAN